MTTQIAMSREIPFLHRAIQGDAAYCALCGIAATLSAGTLAGWLGLEVIWPVIGLGVGLILYAAWLISLVQSGKLNSTWGWIITAFNIAWIDGSGLLLWKDWLPMEPAGRTLVIIVAAIVGIFAILQAYGAWQLRKAGN